MLTAYRLIKNKKGIKKILMIPLIFLCEFMSGSWPWQTYSSYKYNFEARIALSPSIRFGIGGVIFLYLLQPLFEKICNKLKEKQLNIISIFLAIIFVIDIICTSIIK